MAAGQDALGTGVRGRAALGVSTMRCASQPARSISSAIGPKLTLTDAWVATAPTPASSHGTTGPTDR